MILSTQIRQLIEQAFGAEVRYPGDCEGLSMEIARKTGQPVSVNTLKRLFGIIGPEVKPRRATLDILAQYLDEPDWNALQMRLSGAGNSDFETDPRNVVAALLPIEARVSFRYLPDRFVALEHLGAERFRVAEAENSKLQVDDIVTVHNFCPGYPMIADSVVRNGAELGPFVAGKVSGLTDLYID
ncbi:MAG: hypothetical protein IKH24_03860 [Bacteroidales bacterium]|nr:hypothetical protein [Bacteroidales bacterium]